MARFIEDFYYGNIEPQECTTNLTTKVKKSLSELSGKEEHLTSLLTDKEQELFTDYVATYIKFQVSAMQTIFLCSFCAFFRATEKGAEKTFVFFSSLGLYLNSSTFSIASAITL